MLEELLAIQIITYNRSTCLDNTLRQLQQSPFVRCRITVLDDFSSDETPTIAAKYADKFPRYRVIRHQRNIGGDYNFLRARELSTSFYTWIVCDDDNFEFCHAQNVIEAIKTCAFDMLYVASRTVLGWNGYGETRVSRVISDKAKYHRACSFWPSLIFRTEWFTTYCLAPAPYLFPSFRFINNSMTYDFWIYVSEYPLVIRSHGPAIEHSPLSLYREWVINAGLLSDLEMRRHVIEEWTDKGFIRTLAFWIALDKANKVDGLVKKIVDMFFAFTPMLRLKLLLLLPLMIIPIPKTLLIRARES